MIDLLERAVIVAVLTGAAASSAVSLCAAQPAWLGRLPPGHRALAIEALLALPWLAPAVVLGAALAPSFLALAWPALDHCGAHDDLHDHFCLLHPPRHDTVSSWTALASLVSGALLVRVLRVAARLRRAHASTARVRLAASPAADGTLSVPSDVPLCAVIGLTSPVILVSDGVRARVSSSHLEIMLAHERAHVARRDVLRHALALLATAAHAPRTARVLLDELAVAREQCCDEAAAVAAGDRIGVAEAILHAARVFGAHPALSEDAAAAFGPRAISSRVSYLLADPVAVPRRAIWSLLGVIALVVGWLPAIHHGLETLLCAVLR